MAAAVTTADIDVRLGRLEGRLDAVSAALVQGDGDALLLASTLLRDAAVEVASLLPVPTAAVVGGGVALKRRVVVAGRRFAECRELLARRAAAVDRSIASLFPPSEVEQATYSRGAGRSLGGSRFGGRMY